MVISSCGHVGIVNSARQAQEVSGVQKIHALVGGFHLGPAPKDYIDQVVGEIKELNPDVVIPMHCSGPISSLGSRAICPDRLIEHHRQPAHLQRVSIGGIPATLNCMQPACAISVGIVACRARRR